VEEFPNDKSSRGELIYWKASVGRCYLASSEECEKEGNGSLVQVPQYIGT
jgi:hypothetical protein